MSTGEKMIVAGLILVVFFLIGLLAYSSGEISKERQVCQSRGGVYLYTGTDGVCLKKEITIQ